MKKLLTFLVTWPRKRLVVLGLVVLVALAVFWLTRGGKSASTGATFVARRGPLDISVLEGGSLQALESQELKCEVHVGYNGTKILKIVEEGYQVTDDDVKTNKVLVELDSSDLEKQLVQQEIQFQSAAASLTDAQQGYEIQLNQNLSDVQAAQQDARFMRMDFDKFLGDRVTDQVVDQIGLDKELAAEAAGEIVDTNMPTSSGTLASLPASAPGGPGSLPTPPSAAPASFPASAQLAALAGKNGGSAGQAAQKPVATNHDGSHAGATIQVSDPPKTVELVDGVQIAHPSPQAAPLSQPESARPGPAAGKDAGAPGRDGSPVDPSAEQRAAGSSGESPHVVRFDFSPYAHIEALGDGEAKQKLRKFDDDLQVARKELTTAQSTLDGTKRLYEKGFVTKNDLDRDEIACDHSRLNVQTADTARDLFLKYEFRRSAEDALSKYVEAARKLDRAKKAAVSKLAQADAKLKSCQGQYQLQLRQRDDTKKQLTKCLIHASKPGLVVYGGSQDGFYWGPQEQVREGATIREQQTIITIPDMGRMCVKVRIHESYIKKVKKGEKAKITVDAFPDQQLDGVVTNVAVLPDSQNRWMNPDLKVYLTTIVLNGASDWIKPGMSAKAEIMVDHLNDVVYAPLQAIAPDGGKQYCYVAHGLSADKREVETGQFNDEFIEIKKGLKEGEKVLLHPPESGEPDGGPKKPEEKAPQKDKSAPATPNGRVVANDK